MWSKTCWFIIDRWMREKALWSYQRFQYIHIWSYIIRCGKKYFVVTVCKLLEQHKNWNVILEIVLTLMVNKLLRCLRRVNISNSKIQEGKKKTPLKIYADFKSISVPEDNEKRNSNEFYSKKYQKHVACSYGYKLVWVDDKFRKPFKSYLINLESVLNHN